MSQEKQKNLRIFGLDVMRATAILLVVFSHLYYLVDFYNPLLISLSGIAGYAGVELFFVLSGFLIGSILLKSFIANDFTLSSIFVFLKRRWMRTLPNYYFILLVNIAIGIVLDYEMKEVWRYFLFIQNFSSYSITFFVESWSLSVEEWTYLLIPFLLFVLGMKSRNSKWSFLVIVSGLIVFFHLLRYLFFLSNPIADLNTWNNEVKSVVIYRIDTILFGFLIAWIHYYYNDWLKKSRFYLLILAAHLFFFQFIAMNVMGFEITRTPFYFMVFYFTLSTITFALFLPTFIYWKSAKGVLPQIITYISKWSYSMYLIHYSILTVFYKYFRDNYFSNSSIYFSIFIYSALLFFGSCFLYRFFEKPIMDLRDR